MSTDSSHQRDIALANVPSPPSASGGTRRCTALTRDGRDCPATPRNDVPFCHQHDPRPEVAERRQLERVRGGLEATRQRWLSADTPAPSLASAAETRKLVEDTIQQVRTGQLPPNVGNAVMYGVSVGLKLAELELGAKLAELEAEVARRRLGR
jgi:hypothetical protein